MHWSMHSYATMFCEARVNAISGEASVSRFQGSFDYGRILNAKTAVSQFRGSIITGHGLALREQTEFEHEPSLAEQHVLVHADVPETDIIWTNIPDPHTPMGATGVARSALPALARRSRTRATTRRANASAIHRLRSTNCFEEERTFKCARRWLDRN
jgi:xanthine dehydrogenase YagR molybdenum-binding subunit